MWGSIKRFSFKLGIVVSAVLFSAAEANEQRYALAQPFKNEETDSTSMAGVILSQLAFIGTFIGFFKRVLDEINEGLESVEHLLDDWEEYTAQDPTQQLEKAPGSVRAVSEDELWGIYRDQSALYRLYSKQAKDIGLRGNAFLQYMQRRFSDAWVNDQQIIYHQIVEKIVKIHGVNHFGAAGLQQMLWQALSGQPVVWPSIPDNWDEQQKKAWNHIQTEITEFNRLHNPTLLQWVAERCLKRDTEQLSVKNDQADAEEVLPSQNDDDNAKLAASSVWSPVNWLDPAIVPFASSAALIADQSTVARDQSNGLSHLVFDEEIRAIQYRHQLLLSRFYQKGVQQEALYAEKDQRFFSRYPLSEYVRKTNPATALYEFRQKIANILDSIIFQRLEDLALASSSATEAAMQNFIDQLAHYPTTLSAWFHNKEDARSNRDDVGWGDSLYSTELILARSNAQSLYIGHDKNREIFTGYLARSIDDLVKQKINAAVKVFYTVQADRAKDEAAIYEFIKEQNLHVEHANEQLTMAKSWHALSEVEQERFSRSQLFQDLLVKRQRARLHAFEQERDAHVLARATVDQQANSKAILHPMERLKYMAAMNDNRYHAKLKLLELFDSNFSKKFTRFLGNFMGTGVALGDTLIALVNGVVVISAVYFELFVPLYRLIKRSLVELGVDPTIFLSQQELVSSTIPLEVILPISALFALCTFISSFFMLRPAVADLFVKGQKGMSSLQRKWAEGHKNVFSKEPAEKAANIGLRILGLIAATGSGLFIFQYIKSEFPSFLQSLGAVPPEIFPLALTVGILVLLEIFAFRGGSLVKEAGRIAQAIKGWLVDKTENPFANLSGKQILGCIAAFVLATLAGTAVASGAYSGLIDFVQSLGWSLVNGEPTLGMIVLAMTVAIASFLCLFTTVLIGLTKTFVGDNDANVSDNEDFVEVVANTNMVSENMVGKTLEFEQEVPNQKIVVDDIGSSGYGVDPYVDDLAGAITEPSTQIYEYRNNVSIREVDTSDTNSYDFRMLDTAIARNMQPNLVSDVQPDLVSDFRDPADNVSFHVPPAGSEIVPNNGLPQSPPTF